jgi:hypothetical protein
VGDLNWQVAQVGDFNGDGRSDILWRNASTGQNIVWNSGNAATATGLGGVADPSWQLLGLPTGATPVQNQALIEASSDSAEWQPEQATLATLLASNDYHADASNDAATLDVMAATVPAGWVQGWYVLP